VLELQGCFETFGAEEVDIIVEHAVKKLVRASNILPHRIDEIITAAIQRRIDCQEVMLLRLATTFGPLRHLILAHPN
jgi:hypothetical protein